MTRLAFRSLAKGIGSYVAPALRSTHQVGGTVSARHCYDLFFRHYGHLTPFLSGRHPGTLVEVGPGSSLGVGLAALLGGIDRYIALDLQDHRDTERDLAILHDLVGLFRERAPFAETTEAGHIFFPPAAPPSVWENLAPTLERTLHSASIESIEAALLSGDEHLTFVAPWTDVNVLPPGSADWLMTHSVMEHVDELDATYAAFARWLKPGGFATHLIDFQSHGLASDWNGHWAVSSPTWALMRGRRPYLINRMWRSQHVELMRRNGFEVLTELRHVKADGLSASELRKPFADMPSGDETVAMSFFVTRKVR